MLSRIHVYAASLGLLLAGPAVAADQSSEAVMLDRASAAAAEPTFELMGFPITRHQVALLGAAQIESGPQLPHSRWPACQPLPTRWRSCRPTQGRPGS